jgi:hypothetical protein
MKCVWLLVVVLAVAGCSRNVELPDSVSAPAEPPSAAAKNPHEAWDAGIKGLSTSPSSSGALLADAARKLGAEARGLEGDARAAALDENIVRLREAIPPVAATKGGDAAAAALRMELAVDALAAGDLPLARETAENVLASNVDPNSPTFGDAIHDMNLVLASVALGSDNPGEARRRIMQASHTPGSDRLNAFGPHFAVVLELHDPELTIDYLGNVKKFWASELPDRWIKSLQAGKSPDDGIWKLATTK